METAGFEFVTFPENGEPTKCLKKFFTIIVSILN